jgi:hypothetical protein
VTRRCVIGTVLAALFLLPACSDDPCNEDVGALCSATMKGVNALAKGVQAGKWSKATDIAGRTIGEPACKNAFENLLEDQVTKIALDTGTETCVKSLRPSDLNSSNELRCEC